MYKHYLSLAILFVLCAAPVLAGNVVTQTNTPNAAILPDNGCTDDTTGTGGGGITDMMTFTETGVIDDVDVRVEITHTWRSDIQMSITYDQGASPLVLLANNVDTSGDNFFATFDSEGAALCSDAANCGTTTNCVAAPGPVCQPPQSLTAFDGLDCPGTFTLAICDRAAADLGTLVAWEVTVTGSHIPVELQTFTVD